MNIDDGKYSDFILRPQCGEYKLNFQGGVWRRDIFASYVREHESPWEFETKGSIRTFESNYRFYTLKNLALNPIDYGKKKGLSWGAVRGKWVFDDVVPLFEKENLNVNFEKRGFFDINNYNDITNVSKTDFLRELKSYGFGPWLRMCTWRVKHIFEKVLHLKYDRDYVAFRRGTQQR